MPAYTVSQYLNDLRAIRATGTATDETSFYPPLANLLNAAGDTLKPKVLFSTQLRDDGAGRPDGGLFPQPRIVRSNTAPPPPQLPDRGAVEIKPAGDDLDRRARTPQILEYLSHYRLLLLTNYHEFRLLKLDAGQPKVIERYVLASTPNDLWHGTPDPKHEGLLLDFFRRVMLQQVPITDPKEVAWFLASYAREARARAEDHDLPFFRTVKSALEESLGITFEGDKGDHFFRSTLVQTLFYGVFSAWVLWRRSAQAVHHAPAHPLTPFNWRLADEYLHVPILRKLFREISDRRTLNSIQIAEILDLAAGVLNRVEPSLFDVFRAEEAVAYFYEPFLQAFDPQLRKDLGVWYTPREIVDYMVERVDHLLRTQLAQPLGLASPAVRILDPCCGTGAYLSAVLRRIHSTLLEQAGDDPAHVPSQLRTAALTRVFGFEIMPAPFVIAHMEINRLLEEAGAPLREGDGTAPAERAGVFLTNALTGWVPATHPNAIFDEMQQEREAAEDIKQQGTILVILGNPPYNGYAGIARIDEERDLTLAYRAPVAGLPAPQGQGLNDLYIRFFRIAERRIAQNPQGQGIVSFISNNAWLDGLSHTSMRSHFLQTFQQLYIDNLNGDKYRTGKTTPDGHPDPSAFSTRTNREGIQVGTAIATLVRGPHQPAATQPVILSAVPTILTPHNPVILSAVDTNRPPAQSRHPEHSRHQPAPAQSRHPERSPAPLPDEVEGPRSSQPNLSRSNLSASAARSIHLRDLWGTHKLSHLERESRREQSPAYVDLTPNPALGLPFAPRIVSAAYTNWPKLPKLFPLSFAGIKTSRDQFVVDIDRKLLVKRMSNYLDEGKSDEEIKKESPVAMLNAKRFNAKESRRILLRSAACDIGLARARGDLSSERQLITDFASFHTQPYLYRPFDQRWLFWEDRTKLLDEKREEYRNAHIGSPSMICAQSHRKTYDPPCITNELASLHVIEKGSSIIPSTYSIDSAPGSKEILANSSKAALDIYLGKANPEDLFFHALATMHTCHYSTENAGALLSDWPRIPLPATANLLTHSAHLGRRLANLLDAESTAELPRESTFLAALKLPPHPGDLRDHPEDLSLTAGWGARGQGATVMPGRGRTAERPWTPAELAKLTALAQTQSLTQAEALTLLGSTCFDIYLNAPRPGDDSPSVFWSTIPANVWTYTLGGYQVLKKWLSYREQPLLGRPLKLEEAAWFSEVVRRITCILLLGPALDQS